MTLPTCQYVLLRALSLLRLWTHPSSGYHLQHHHHRIASHRIASYDPGPRAGAKKNSAKQCRWIVQILCFVSCICCGADTQRIHCVVCFWVLREHETTVQAHTHFAKWFYIFILRGFSCYLRECVCECMLRSFVASPQRKATTCHVPCMPWPVLNVSHRHFYEYEWPKPAQQVVYWSGGVTLHMASKFCNV